MRPALTQQTHLVSPSKCWAMQTHQSPAEQQELLKQRSAIPRGVYGASGSQLAPRAWIALCCAIPHVKLLFTTLYASGKYVTQPSLDMTLSFRCSLFVTLSSPGLHSHGFKTKRPQSTGSCSIRSNFFCSCMSSFEWQL